LSSISWGSMTFMDVPTDPTGGSYTLSFSSCPEIPMPRQEAVHRHFGLDGRRAVDGGSDMRQWRMTGLIIADGEAGLVSAWAALKAAQGSGVDTQTRYGEALEDVDCPAGPRPLKCQTGRYIYQEFEMVWRQL
jgi:hypothetical protein